MSDPRRGEIYYVDDSEIRMPPEENRNWHSTGRPFLIYTSNAANNASTFPIVSGFPLSSKDPQGRGTDLDVEVPDAEKGTGRHRLRKDTWVRVALLQPIAKSKLGKRATALSQDTMDEIDGIVREHLALY